MIYNYLISPSPAYFGQIEFIKVKKKKEKLGSFVLPGGLSEPFKK
jgi:hypothetical protein